MPAIIAPGSGVCNTSTGNQDFTIPGLGFTPKGYIVWVTRGVTNGAPGADAVVSMGASDDTNSWALAASNEDNEVSSSAWTNSRNTGDVIWMLDPSNGNRDGSANHVAMIADGFRVNWNNSVGGAYLVQFLLFGGADLQCFASDDLHDGGVDSVRTYGTGTPGFQPDQGLVGSISEVLQAGKKQHYQFSQGYFCRLPTITQGCASSSGVNAATPTIERAKFSDDCVMDRHLNGVHSGQLEVTAIGATTFDLTKRDVGNNMYFTYFVWTLGGVVDCWGGHYDLPTALGDADITTVGFQPKTVLSLLSFCDTLGVERETGATGAGVRALGAFDDTRAWANSDAREDNVTTTNTQSLGNTIPVHVARDTGVVAHQATFVQMLTNGWRLNYSVIDTTPRKAFSLAIEEEGAGAPGLQGTLNAATAMQGQIQHAGLQSTMQPVVTMQGAMTLALKGTLQATVSMQGTVGAAGLQGTMVPVVTNIGMWATASMQSTLTAAVAMLGQLTTPSLTSTLTQTVSMQGIIRTPAPQGQMLPVVTMQGTMFSPSFLGTLSAVATMQGQIQHAGLVSTMQPTVAITGRVGEDGLFGTLMTMYNHQGRMSGGEGPIAGMLSLLDLLDLTTVEQD